MKAVVTKINKNQAIIIKSNGTFTSVPDKNYKVGQEIYVKDSSKQGFVRFARIAAAAAVLFAMVGSGAVYAYNTPQSYISIDVNSSVELEVNMFNHVISAVGVNENGTAVLEKVEITHKSLDEAIELIIYQAHLNDSLGLYDAKTVVVGVHSVNPDVEQKVMESAKEQIYESLESLQVSTTVSVANVDIETLETARNFGTTAGKMNLIEDYLETAPDDISVDDLIDVSVDKLSEGIHENNRNEKSDAAVDSSNQKEEKINNGKSDEAKAASTNNSKANNSKASVPKASAKSNDDNAKDNNKDEKTNNGKKNVEE